MENTGKSTRDPQLTATQFKALRFPDAHVVFLAGSVVRAEATPTSDLDLVVVFDKVEKPYRESFVYDGWPIEVFVHDPETLVYFFQKIDGPSGVPALPTMVAEGIPIPSEDAFSKSLQNLAKMVLDEGPRPLSILDHENYRYAITDLTDDIRYPRSKAELTASGAKLYELLADYALRQRGMWSARRKTIPRRLGQIDAGFASDFIKAFDRLFIDGIPDDVIAVSESLMAPYGGTCHIGYKRAKGPKDRLPWTALPYSGQAFRFEFLKSGDIELLHRWLNEPHVVKHLGGPQSISEVEEKYLRERASNPISTVVASVGGVPIGFIQCFGAAKTGVGWWSQLDREAVVIEPFIAEIGFLGKSFGPALIQQFVKKLFDEDSSIKEVFSAPTLGRHKAIRAFEKAGFERLGLVDIPAGKALLMRVTR